MQDDNRNIRNGGEKSVLSVLLEIAKLLCLLCWKGIKAFGRLILKGLKHLLRWMVIAILWIIDSLRWVGRKMKAFWTDNNTQEKLRKIGRGLKKGALAVLAGIWIGIIYIFKGIVWLFKKLFVGLLHLRTTLKIIGRWIGRTAVRFWTWLKRQGAKFRAWTSKKKQQYKSFRRNQGFKGLLIDMRDAMRGSISNYIENDQQRDKPNEGENPEDQTVVMEEETSADEADDESEEDVKGIRKFGRRIYKAMKRLVEV